MAMLMEPCRRARVFDECDIPIPGEPHAPVDYPLFYDPVFFPELFPSASNIALWLAAMWNRQASSCHEITCFSIGVDYVLNDLCCDKSFVLNYSRDVAASILTVKLAVPDVLHSSNPDWLFENSDAVADRCAGAKVTDLRNVKMTSDISRMNKPGMCRAIGDSFQRWCREYAVKSDFDLFLEFSSLGVRDSGNVDRRTVLWYLLVDKLSVNVFEAIVRPQEPVRILSATFGQVTGMWGDVVVDRDFSVETLSRRLRKVAVKDLRTSLSSMLSSHGIRDMRISRRRICEILSASLSLRWHEVVHGSRYVIGDLLSRYQPDVELKSSFNAVTLLCHEYGKVVCDQVIELCRKQRVALSSKAERQQTRQDNFEKVERAFRKVQEEWPTPVDQQLIYKRCREFQQQYDWPKRTLCAVCSRETWKGEPMPFVVEPVEEIMRKRVGQTMKSLLVLRKDEKYHNRADHDALRNLMVDGRALSSQGLSICQRCYNTLEGGHLPRLALRNHLYRGELPERFRSLTWVEEMVCSIYRCTAHVSRLYGKTSSLKQPRVLHGNTCAHNMNAISTADVLPRVPQDLLGMISVIFVGPHHKIKDVLRHGFTIRKALVMEFLQWLSINNPLYEEVRIDMDLFKHYDDNPDGVVLPGLEDVVFHEDVPDVDEMFEEETAGFQPHFAGELEDKDDEEEPCLLERMGVSDIESVALTGRSFTAAALDNLVKPTDNKPDMIIFRGRDPIKDYNNPDLFPGMFPTLFPYGIGGFDVPSRKPRLSMEMQANYYLDLYDREFRYHNSFIFVIMNVMQRHAINRQTRLAVEGKKFESVASVIETIKPETLKAVSMHLKNGGTISSVPEQHKHVFTLLREVNTVAGKVTGSEASKILYRNEIRSYVGHFGIPHLFFTANPNPAHNPLYQLMWGDESVDLSERFPVLVEYNERAKRLAADPVAALDFFNRVTSLIFKCLFGWDFENRRSSLEGGILGHLEAFYSMDELTERGSYHRHSLITLNTL